MIVEVLHVRDCPGYERVLPTVRRLAAQAGAEVRTRCIETHEQAEQERFLGSPTVRVDGVDVEPDAGRRSDYGLECRLYRPHGGPPSPTPPDDWIHTALRRA